MWPAPWPPASLPEDYAVNVRGSARRRRPGASPADALDDMAHDKAGVLRRRVPGGGGDAGLRQAVERRPRFLARRLDGRPAPAIRLPASITEQYQAATAGR